MGITTTAGPGKTTIARPINKIVPPINATMNFRIRGLRSRPVRLLNYRSHFIRKLLLNGVADQALFKLWRDVSYD